MFETACGAFGGRIRCFGKLNVNKVNNFYCIVFILVASCSLQSRPYTLPFYWLYGCYTVDRLQRIICAVILCVELTRWSNARWPLVLSRNIIGIGYNGASHIDEVRLFATKCHFGHSIGVSVVVRRPIRPTSAIYCFRK